jgi:4-amino-4-deoxy-L-arabinose transferase-like glycosyltransferase
MGRESRDAKSLAIVFVVGLFLRLMPMLVSLDMGIALDDMFQYDALAESIRLGQGYTWYGGIPTAFRAPLYPLFLAIIYGFFGHQFLAVRVIQAMMGASLPLIVYVLGRRMFDDRAARIASWVIVFYPMFLFYPLGLVTENLFFVLVPLTILYLIKALDTSRLLYYLLGGLLLGLSVLTRSVMSGFVLVILAWLWYYVSDKREALKSWALILLSVALLTIPWSIRNSLLYGQFVFVESSLGFNFYLGYHPEGAGTFDSSIAVDFMEGIGGFDDPGLETEKLVHNLGIQRGVQFIQKDPARAAWLLVSKLSHFLRLDKRAALFFYSNNFLGDLPAPILLLVLLVLCLPWVIVVLLSVIGMSFSRMTRDKVLIYLLFIYFIAIHILIMAEPRFHLVLVPFLAIFAVQGARILPRVRGQLQARDVAARRNARWRLIWCLLVMALLVLNWVYELNVDMEKLRLVFSPGGNMARFTY